MRISTPEGVDVELTLAGIGSRFIAAIFDFADPVVGDRSPRRSLLGVTGGDGGGWAAPCSRSCSSSSSSATTCCSRSARAGARPASAGPACGWCAPAGSRSRSSRAACATSCGSSTSCPRRSTRSGCSSIFVTTREPAARRPRRGHAGRARAPRRLRSAEPAPRVRRAAPPTAGTSAPSRPQDIGTVRQFLARRHGLAAGAARRAGRASSSGACARCVAGAPESLAAEEFLERLSAAKR